MKEIKSAIDAINSALVLLAQIKGAYIIYRDLYDVKHPNIDPEENPFNSILDDICEAWTDAGYVRRELNRVSDFLITDVGYKARQEAEEVE